jgi:Carboxypeptidase regulatory-like domain
MTRNHVTRLRPIFLKSIPVLSIIYASLMLVCCGPLFAQAGVDTGSVTGTVRDATKALVVGARCTLTNTATGGSQKVISTSAGAYTFPVVQVGSYSLRVVKPGFKDSVVDGIVVHLGSTVTADVALQVGAASMEVTVTSAAPLLQAQDASLGMTVDSTMANDLPLFGGSGGRNFMDLATIAAGVQFTGSAVNTNTFLVHGVESGQVDVRLNGADDNAEVFGGITIPPIPDAIQEFKLEDGNNSADLGHGYGAVVSVATKQGTNQFKGSAWEYNENDMFNANDYFNKLHQLVTGSPKLPNRPGRYKENSFGGLIGGPVILPHLYNGHNRTFFTVDYQATFYTSSSTFTGTVPTESMANSNFSDLSDTLTLSNQGSTSNPQTSEKEDAVGRWFQIGMMLDPATTREVPCGTNDPITGLPTNCKVGYAPTINGKQYAILRDPFISGAGGCPSLHGTTIFNSSYNKANGSQTTYAPTCFNQLPAGRLDPNAVALLKMFPAPNQPTITYGNNYLVTQPGTYNTQQYDVRIDHTISQSDSVLGTFSHYNSIVHPTPPFPGVIEGGSNVGFWTTNPTYMVVLTETHVFTPNLINEFRASDEHNWNTRMDPNAIDTTYGTPGQYGIQGIPQTTDNGGLPTFTVDSGISSFGARTNTTWQKVGAWQFSDNITKLAGKHQLKFGGEVNLTYGDIVQLPYSRGSFTYNGEFSNTPNSGDTDTGLADFLLVPSQATSTYATAGGVSTGTNLMGGLDAYAGDNWTKSTYHSPYIALYVVDTWKATPNFTVNVGLREEHFAPYSSEGGQEANFWMGGSDGNQPSGSTYYIAHDGCKTPMSPSFTGLLAYDNIPIVCQPHNTANEMPKANWAPRIGLAYRIRPNLVARVGGGIAYGAFGSVGYGGTLGQNYPFLFTVKSGSSVNPYTPQLIGTGNNATATMENTFNVINMDDPLAAYIPLGSAVMTGKQYHYDVPNVTTLTAALQWQFTNHDSIEGRYVGNVGRHLDTLGPYHNAPRELLTTNTSAVTACSSAQLSANPYCENTPAMANGDGNVVPFPNMSLNTLMDPTNQISDYQSGEAEYRHQFLGGFTMDSNYTFTRCWGDTQAGEQNAGDPTNGRAPMVLGFGGYRSDYDRCSNLAAQMFRLSGEFNLPVGQGAPWVSNVNGWENAIIGGWKLAPVWIAASGTLNNITCQGTNGYGASPTFTGPWFQTGSTDWVCEATTEPGQPLYGPGPKDKPRTKINGYWNSSAFTAPEEAVQANGQLDFTPLGGRGNQLYGPGWYNINIALHKQFNTFESTRLEIQGQAMNLFNHMEPSNPSTSNYTTPTSESLTGGWGTVTSTRMNNGEGRIWQFVGKFYF